MLIPVAFSVLVDSVVIVPAGNRGIVLRFGRVTGVTLGEGIHIIRPISDEVKIVDVRVKALGVQATASSRDLQNVTTQVTLNYRPEADFAGNLYQDVNYEHEARIIAPALQESVKAATALHNAEDLIVNRPAVKADIEERLRARLSSYHIVVDAVQITDFSFSAEFSHAIELKVTATQNALQEQNKLEAVKAQAQQTIEQAKAQAESLRLQRENVSKDLIELRRIELQAQAIAKWNGTMPLYITENSPVPIVDVFRK